MIRRFWKLAGFAVLAGCSGGTSASVAPIAPPPVPGTTPTVVQSTGVLPTAERTEQIALPAAASGRHAIALDGPFKAEITLRSRSGATSLEIGSLARRADSKTSSRTCPPIPNIAIRNPFRFPIVIELQRISFTLYCTPASDLYGLSDYQKVPLPPVVSPTKLGDASIAGTTLTFTPTAASLTLAPKSTTVLLTLAEESTSEVAIPVTPGTASVLTANAPNVPSLAVSYASASGASEFGSSCFNAYDAQGRLAQDLVGQQILGTPKLYCLVDTAGGPPLTLGANPSFTVDFSQIDIGLLQLDGPIRTVPCSATAATETCTTTQFTIGSPASDYQKIIVANARDLAACFPQVVTVDCNVPPSATPAPATAVRSTSATGASSRSNGALALLVANDATYVSPAFGGYALTVSQASAGVCQLNVGPDDPESYPDYPPGYYDPAALPGSSPTSATYPADAHSGSAEFDITTLGSGTCTIDIAETTGLHRHLTASTTVP